MAAKYVLVTLEQVREVLKAEKGWKETVQQGSKEYVFVWTIPECPCIDIKVYSSIKLQNGMGRKCGGDAFRVCAVNTVSNSGWVKAPRVHRVEHWRDNLRNRILQVLADSKKRFIGVA